MEKSQANRKYNNTGTGERLATNDKLNPGHPVTEGHENYGVVKPGMDEDQTRRPGHKTDHMEHENSGVAD